MNTIDTVNRFVFDYDYDLIEIKEKLLKALDYLHDEIKIPSKIFLDANGYYAMVFIGKTIGYKINCLDGNMEVFIEKEFHIFLGDLLYYLSDVKNELDFKASINFYNAELLTDLNDKRVAMLTNSLYINNIILLYSSAFSTKFSLHSGLKAHFSFIKDTEFTKNKQNAKMNMLSKQISVIQYIVMNISSLSKMVDENKIVWKQLESVDALIKIANLMESTKFDAYIAIANIADDKQIESLNEMNLVVDMILSQLKQAEIDFSSNKLKRDNRQAMIENAMINCSVHCLIQKNGTYTSVIVLLNGLYKILVNEKMKNDIYFNYELCKYLKKLLALGNSFEIYFTLRLFAQLSFSEKIANDLANDNEFMDILADLSTKTAVDSNNENERKVIQIINRLKEDINWNLNKNKKSEAHSELTNENKHVMISYNTASRDLCLKIKENLESSGYQVWIDVNDIHGSSLDAMAKAVEDSFCVLMCVTEKYRQSVNCQAEAQYAFKLNKKIIPVIMQKGYENVQGWLGIIMGDKIFVNFTKYDHVECLRRLKHEIDSCKNAKQIARVAGVAITTAAPTQVSEINSSSSANDSIESWDDGKVKAWFVANNLSLNIYESLKPCNGQIIKQLYEMKCTASEFYYQSVNKVESNFRSITLFTLFLNKLFNS